MTQIITTPAARLRILLSRLLSRLGFGDNAFLLLLSVVVGIVTAAAAVAFHELIDLIRDLLYRHFDAETLYSRDMGLLLFLPALGGLAVGVFSKYIMRAREGHGIVDVMESVTRTTGFQKPITAIEKILTSAMTIGSGGSAGAEGPIVQIGAGIASGVGGIFRLARQHMPILTGCGCAAGISAIFNAPFGGVLFALEIILQDFSLRVVTPIVVSSVIAQVTVQAIFQSIGSNAFRAIFAMPTGEITHGNSMAWAQVGNFMIFGVVCGLIGLALTRLMYAMEEFFHHLKVPAALRPAVGGLALGAAGVIYIILSHKILGVLKPFDRNSYPMPAFYGDGYGVVQQLLVSNYYATFRVGILGLLIFLCFIKVVGTCLTLGSGGSGGVIAPSLFIGATAGGAFGMILQHYFRMSSAQPQLYALVGMGAILAAVVHAPFTSILICFELTQDYKVMLPAMLACVVATGVSRMLFADSIYTLGLRRRGIRVGGGADSFLLRRLTVEQVPLEPAATLRMTDPLQRALDMLANGGSGDFVVTDSKGNYAGMIVAEDMRATLLERDAIPLLTCGDVMRPDLPVLESSNDLSTALETFAVLDVERLPVCVHGAPLHIVGLLSRTGLMRRYQKELATR
ncbi:MAG TPA: chloride channel protein [Tepidisphaeraceae bacterium]|nr:chloride channel protein [Tepidisphaeraceae bacterium]